jgi:hypothetical protein
MASPVPEIEVPDDADPFRVRRPDGEIDAIDAVQAGQVRAQLVERAEVAALAQQVKIDLA